MAANALRQVPRAQHGVAEAVGVVLRPAQPAAQEPEQALARIVERGSMHGAQVYVGRFEFHQVVEAIDQRFHLGFAADPLEGRIGGRLFFCLHA